MRTGSALLEALDAASGGAVLPLFRGQRGSQSGSSGKRIPFSRKISPAKAKMDVGADLSVANADRLRHLESGSLALDRDVTIKVKLVCDELGTRFETESGIMMDVDDPAGTLGSSCGLDPAMASWVGAFKKAVEDARSRIPRPAVAEIAVEWAGELRLTAQRTVYWAPSPNPDFSSIEELCETTIAVWTVMDS